MPLSANTRLEVREEKNRSHRAPGSAITFRRKKVQNWRKGSEFIHRAA